MNDQRKKRAAEIQKLSQTMDDEEAVRIKHHDEDLNSLKRLPTRFVSEGAFFFDTL